MTTNRCEQLLADHKIWKCDDLGKFQAISQKHAFILEFWLIPEKDYQVFYSELKSRAMLFLYPLSERESYDHLPEITQKRNTVLVNSTNPESACTYNLTVDFATKTARVKIFELPENGQIYMTDNDLIGISKSIWKPDTTHSASSQTMN